MVRKKQTICFGWRLGAVERPRVLSSCTGITMIRAGGCQHNLPRSQLNLEHNEGLESWERGLELRDTERVVTELQSWEQGLELRDTELSLLARRRSWPKWSAFLNASQDFYILNAIVWVDANNLGVIFYRSSGSCLGNEHPDGGSFGSVACAITPACGQRIYHLWFHPYSACIFWAMQPCVLRLAAFFSSGQCSSCLITVIQPK